MGGYFSRMSVFCPICKTEMGGMRGYGESNTCGERCHREWEWRRTLAILRKDYYADPRELERAASVLGEAIKASHEDV